MLTNRSYINEQEITSAILTSADSEIEIPRLQITLKSGQTIVISEDAKSVWGKLNPNLQKLNLIRQSQIECLQ
jgi:hypothetical protein